MRSLIAAVVCMLVVAVTHADTSPYCPSPARSSPAKLSILSFRNPTGQWTSQLNFTRGMPGDADVWDIDLAQEKVSCGDGGELVTTLLTLTLLPEDIAPTKPATSQATTLKPGYQEVPGVGIFKLHTTANTWAGARDVCSSEGTHLAIINSQAEALHFKKVVEGHEKFSGSSDNGYIFLGFENSETQKKFVTVLGNELNSTGYVVWAQNEPNSIGSQGHTCGGMGRNGELNDLFCSARLGFFCEE